MEGGSTVDGVEEGPDEESAVDECTAVVDVENEAKEEARPEKKYIYIYI